MNLYDHQEKIITADPKRALIALGTGGGKTRVCLELAEGTVLVVCPKQQKLDGTWKVNAKKFGLVLDLMVVSKEEFRRDAHKLGRFDTVIFDECHTILGVIPDTRQRKGIRIPKTSQLFEAALEFTVRTKPERLYLASATPVSKPMQCWALATLFGRKWDFFKFRDAFYIERPMGYRSLWIPRRTDTSKQKLADLTKSFGYTGQLSDWFDVPEQTHETIYVELTEEQGKAIQEIEQEEADPMVRRAKIRTIENGILYSMDVVSEDDHTERLNRRTIQFNSEKLGIIKRFVSSHRKVLIFAAFTGQIEAIKSFLRNSEGWNDKSIYALTGQTKDRATVIQEAEKADKAIVIAQASISSGYELPSFPCVIFASKSYRYVDYEQALGRVLRANALKKNLFVHLVVKDGVDEDCHKAIMSGQDFQERLMENI